MYKRKCPVCSSDNKHKVDEINLVNFDGDKGIFDHQLIVCCDDCGYVYHEDFDIGRMDEHYSMYTGGGQIQEMTADELVLNTNMANFIEYHIHTSKDAKVLDVGCGYGWVIDLLKKRGFTNVYGMDTDEPLMEKLMERGYSVEIGSVYSKDKLHLEGNCDVIILKMVMEHLENPYSAIDNIRKWLKPEGILVIEVPDCSLYDKTAFFRGYFQSVNMEHINNYSSVSLMNLMRNWRMVACESTESNGIFPVLRMAFKYENGYERKIVIEKNDETAIVKSIRKSSAKGSVIDKKIESLRGKTCVVWGVSAFTRGLLTYTELKDLQIEFFVDRNEYLQSKTLCGKPIVSPADLKDFDGVIIIPGKNSEIAIRRNIKELGYGNEVVSLGE